MDSVKLSLLKDFAGFIPADIFQLIYDEEGLYVRVQLQQDGLAALFTDSIGFRLLDEGDLLEFWLDEEYNSDGWVYEVKSGGWLDMESARPGFLSANRKGLKEYLVASENDCVSVLAFNDPRKTEHDARL